MSPTDRIPLPRVPLELTPLIEGPPPSYRRLYNLAVDTRIPTVLEGSRMFVLRDDLPQLIATLGLTPKSTQPATGRNRSRKPAEQVAA